MLLLPAIDLRQGRVVRLRQGDFARETVFPDDPVALASRYAEAGATWLHVVDLDAARSGSGGGTALPCGLMRSGLQLQVGGGVRSASDIQRLIDAGVTRVVAGSVAARDPLRVCDWLTRFGAGRLTVALDVRWRDNDWRVASAGWTQEENVTLDELVPQFAAAGARQLLCTDIDRDGTLAGPNFPLYAYLRKLAPALQLQVSGGVRGLEDIRAARASGAAAVVLGRALLEGRFTLPQALAC